MRISALTLLCLPMFSCGGVPAVIVSIEDQGVHEVDYEDGMTLESLIRDNQTLQTHTFTANDQSIGGSSKIQPGDVVVGEALPTVSFDLVGAETREVIYSKGMRIAEGIKALRLEEASYDFEINGAPVTASYPLAEGALVVVSRTPEPENRLGEIASRLEEKCKVEIVSILESPLECKEVRLFSDKRNNGVFIGQFAIHCSDDVEKADLVARIQWFDEDGLLLQNEHEEQEFTIVRGETRSVRFSPPSNSAEPVYYLATVTILEPWRQSPE